MKAKLILKHRGDNDYFLISRTDNSEALYASLNPDGEFEQKLSKQNCDEIFGVVDVEKLAEESWGDKISSPYYSYIEGFNKAMELNKDKMFTLGQLITAMDMARVMVDGKYANSGEYIYNFIQQPTEIEVEIIMRNSRTGNIVKHDSDLEWDEDGLCDRAIPKLDSSGCLILKKI
jgi:hypothetical protein